MAKIKGLVWITTDDEVEGRIGTYIVFRIFAEEGELSTIYHLDSCLPLCVTENEAAFSIFSSKDYKECLEEAEKVKNKFFESMIQLDIGESALSIKTLH